jgi:hypothetical protein
VVKYQLLLKFEKTILLLQLTRKVLDHLNRNVAFSRTSGEENNRVTLNANVNDGLLVGASNEVITLIGLQ